MQVLSVTILIMTQISFSQFFSQGDQSAVIEGFDGPFASSQCPKYGAQIEGQAIGPEPDFKPCPFGLAGQDALCLSGPGVDPIGDDPGH